MYRYVGRHGRGREIVETILYPRHWGRHLEVLSVHHYHSPTSLVSADLTTHCHVVPFGPFQHLRLREEFVTKAISLKIDYVKARSYR